MADLSIVIVTYNSASTIAKCLDAATHCSDDVVVVDNASSDQTASVARGYRGARLIANSVNRGFAGGVNQGVVAARHPVILILNPDAHLLNSPAPLALACLDTGFGAAAGMLTGEQGQPQQGFTIRRLPTPWSLSFEVLGLNRAIQDNPVNRRWRALDIDLHRPQDVEQPAGAFLAFRREAWESIGGFDEGFSPVWFDDVDFSRRLRLAGFKTRYVPEVRARHRGGDSIRSLVPGDRQVQWYVSLLRYAAVSFGGSGQFLVAASVVAASFPRSIRVAINEGSFRPLAVHAKIFGLGLRSMAAAFWGKKVTEAQARRKRNTRNKISAIAETNETHTHA